MNLISASPQGCVLSTLYTNNCTPTPPSNSIIKFANDTTILGFISRGDEFAYWDEGEQLLGWCTENNLILNPTKTKEVVMDFRWSKKDIKPLSIGGFYVERISISSLSFIIHVC